MREKVKMPFTTIMDFVVSVEQDQTPSNLIIDLHSFAKRLENFVGKGNCSLRAISPFLTVFSQDCTADM